MYVSRQLERVIRAIMKRDYLEWSNRITAPRYTYNSARKMRNTRGVKNPLTWNRVSKRAYVSRKFHLNEPVRVHNYTSHDYAT